MINNKKTEVAPGTMLNDKDYINDLLSCLKEMTKNYAVALTEASNEYLYNEYKEVFDKISKMQRDVFELMFRNGWYSLEEVKSTKLKDKYNTLSGELKTLEEE